MKKCPNCLKDFEPKSGEVFCSPWCRETHNPWPYVLIDGKKVYLDT